MLPALHQKGKNVSVESIQKYHAWRQNVELLTSGRAPSGLIIKGPFSLALVRVRSLPESLTIKGDLDLRQCQRLSRIGDGLRIHGDLLIGGRLGEVPFHQKRLQTDKQAPFFLKKLSQQGQCPLEFLPEKLDVKGDLAVRGCTRLKSLPQQLKLGGSLLINGCHALETLPDPLVLNGDLCLIGCSGLRKLPKQLLARRLIVIGCGIETLPEEMVITESIHIESCSQLQWPTRMDCLESGGLEQLTIYNCAAHKLPENIVLRDRIHFVNLNTKELTSYLTAKLILIRKCCDLETVSGIITTSKLRFNNCTKLRKISELPQKIQILDLTNCQSLEALPDSLLFRSKWPDNNELILTNCKELRNLPTKMAFDGRLEVSGCGLTGLPKKMHECRVLWHGHFVPSEMVFYPETLTPQDILTQPNAEIRRLMLERVGIDKVLNDAKAVVIHADKDVGGDRSLLKVRRTERFRQQDRVFLYLRCRCPSTGREYLLPVPREFKNCHVAAAWLAGFDNSLEYQPILET
jgi:hypothetical protein